MAEETFDDKKMPLLDHLVELRQRLLWSVVGLIVAFVVCFYFAQSLLNFLAAPLADILLDLTGEQQRRLIFTSLIEPFFAQVKVAFFFAAFLSCPIFLTQIWLFVAPGLYKNERSALAPFLIASPILFFAGGALVYYVIFPLAWRFFVGFEQAGSSDVLPVELEARIGEYLSLSMKLIFAFGICFQLPVIMTLLARVGIASSQGMASKRKYAIVAVVIVAAILTPPDPISQISLAVPIIALYEISIHLARLVEKRRAEAEEKAYEEALR